MEAYNLIIIICVTSSSSITESQQKLLNDFSLLPSAEYDTKSTIVNRLQYLRLLWSLGSLNLRVVTVALINESNNGVGSSTFKIILIQENQFKIYLDIDKICKDKNFVITKKKNYEESIYENDPFLKKVVNNIIKENHQCLHGYSDIVHVDHNFNHHNLINKV
ncbi:hypothetical protein ACTFIR_009815 [Dictyostelium discoideum]